MAIGLSKTARDDNWEPFMTRKEAVAMAKELSTKGMTQAEIATKLADAGYLSSKTNKAIAASSVCMMLKGKRRQRSTPPPDSSFDSEEAQGHGEGQRHQVDPEAQRHGRRGAYSSGAAGA